MVADPERRRPHLILFVLLQEQSRLLCETGGPWRVVSQLDVWCSGSSRPGRSGRRKRCHFNFYTVVPCTSSASGLGVGSKILPARRSSTRLVMDAPLGQYAHLLPPSWTSTITQWLAEDTPSFDYGGYVVGESEEEATLLGKQSVRLGLSCPLVS